MRTLSARILLGFIALTITFGVFAATIIVNLREVEDQARLILNGYVPLTMASSDLERQQGYLKTYLDQGIMDATRAREVVVTIDHLRSNREFPLNEIVNKVGSLDRLATSDGQAAAEGAAQFSRTGPVVDELKQAVGDVAPLYKTLLAAPPLRVPSRTDPSFQAAYDALDADHRAAYDTLLQLRDKEKQVSSLVATIKSNFGTRTTLTRNWLANNERTILVRALYLGIVTVLLGLVITAWVAVTLRPLRRLREGARRIAAGDYGKRISETGPTEIADLAREFNSMGRAVQEREEEKLRAARIAIAGKMAGQVAHEVRN
ncbi:MAG TPA: HAMP domain-containing protein, partial [Kofleriaceae bacterium]